MEAVEEAHHKNLNKKKQKTYVQVDIKKVIKNRVWKEHLASNQAYKKSKHLEVPTKINQANFKFFVLQILGILCYLIMLIQESYLLEDYQLNYLEVKGISILSKK